MKTSLALILILYGAVAARGQADTSSAFKSGQSDRADWENWFGGLQGDYHTGAQYWSAQRSTPKPGSCANPSMSQAWQDGCAAAQKRLALPDARRRSEADYKLGWNSLPATPVGAASASARSPISQPGQSFAASGPMPQPAVSAQQLWYYCDPARAYYPYVSSCPVQWRAVVPNPSAQDQATQHAPTAIVPPRQPASTPARQAENASNPVQSNLAAQVTAPAQIEQDTKSPGQQTMGTERFSEKNLKEIVFASQNNEMRFDRDYKYKIFSGVGVFVKSLKSLFSDQKYIIEIKTESGEVDCVTSDSIILNEVINWDPGHAVKISGKIESTSLGDLMLGSGCSVVSS
jgi:hypothetical protein